MLGLKVGAFQFSQTSFRQKTVYMLRKVKPLEVNTSLVSLKVPDYISWLDNLGGIESDLLRKRILEALPFLNEEFGKCLAISDAVDKLKPKLTASFATRGYLGSILDTNNLTTNSVCIPHGTVTAKRTDFDFSYRSSIADAVFTGKTNYLALQSKIAQEAYYELKPEGKDLLCGNLIFNEGKNQLVDEKGIILYAVTQKNIYGMQFYGVETYYEFYSNLQDLQFVASKVDMEIFVKLHPSVSGLKKELKDEFKNLIFVTNNLKELLSKALVTISFSSTVIEDSLYSEVPVILFDPWSRYQHCNAEHNEYKINKAIYYTSEVKSLISIIQTIKKSSSFEFEEYTIKGKSKDNFKSLIERLL